MSANTTRLEIMEEMCRVVRVVGRPIAPTSLVPIVRDAFPCYSDAEIRSVMRSSVESGVLALTDNFSLDITETYLEDLS